MGRRKTGRNVHGIVLLDKRQGVSSNRALQEVRCLLDAKKAGHTGSLDPLATGLLPLCFGEATKASAYMLNNDKRYQVGIQLGLMTDSGDLEGKVLARYSVPQFSLDDLQDCLDGFTGEIEQVPPMFSALKYQGKKLYELAREGITVVRKARRIRIFELQLLDYSATLLTLDVFCSKGTYIRTLAEDIGTALGCGGTVQALRRTAVGSFTLESAKTYQELQQMDRESLKNSMLAPDQALTAMPAVQLTAEQAICIKQGQLLALNGGLNGQVRMYAGTDFLGLGEMLLDGRLAPKRLFNIF